MAECIFYITYQTTARPVDVKSLLTLARDLSQRIVADADLGAAPALYTVVAAIACQLDRTNALADPHAASIVRADGNARLLLDGAFVRDVQALLEPRWQHAGAHSALTLAWAVFVAPRGNRADGGPLRDDGTRAPPPVGDADIEALFARAVRGGACLYLAQVTSSSAYRTSVDTRHLLAGVFDELVTGLLTHLSLTNFALCPLPTATSFDANSSAAVAAAAARGRRGSAVSLNSSSGSSLLNKSSLNVSGSYYDDGGSGGGGGVGDDDGGNFLQLMQLVASLYRGEPELAHKFWTYDSTSNSQYAYHFMRHAIDRVSEPIFGACVDMLAALAGGAAVADAASRMLTQGNKYVSWQHFFAALHGFLTDLTRTDSGLIIDPFAGAAGASSVGGGGASASAAVRPMRSIDADNLASMLRLMRVVLHHSEVARAHVLGKAPWRAPETLVALLTCAVPVRVKAALVGVTAALVTTRDVAWRVWKLLDACQLLRTRAAARLLSASGAVLQNGVSASSSSSSSATTGSQATSVPAVRDLRYELTEVEARGEAYPFSRAFVRLVGKLMRYGVPMLSAGIATNSRAPAVSFAPYLAFVRDDVFVPLEARAHINAGERWTTAATCLDVFHGLLAQLDAHTVALDAGVALQLADSVTASLALSRGEVDVASSSSLWTTAADWNDVTRLRVGNDDRRAAAVASELPGTERDGADVLGLALMRDLLTSGSAGVSLLERVVRVVELGARNLVAAILAAAADSSTAAATSSVGASASVDSNDDNASGGAGGARATIGTTSFTLSALNRAAAQASSSGDAASAQQAALLREYGNAIAFEAAVYQALRVLELALLHESPCTAALLNAGAVGLASLRAQLLRRDGAAVLALAALVDAMVPPRVALHALRVLTLLCGSGVASRVAAVLIEGRADGKLAEACADRLVDDGDAERDNARPSPAEDDAGDGGGGGGGATGVDDEFVASHDEFALDAYDEPHVRRPGVAADIRRAIAQLLYVNVRLPAPNVAHVLLGFDTSAPLSRSQLGRAARRSCLPALLDLMASPVWTTRCPRIAEQCYSLIEMLCQNAETSAPTLAFLRAAPYDFFAQHVMHVDASPFASDADHISVAAALRTRAALLRAVALDVHAAAMAGRSAYTARVITRLFDVSSSSSPSSTTSTAAAGALDADDAAPLLVATRPRMLEHFDAIVALDDPILPPAPTLHVLGALDIGACVEQSRRGVPTIALRRLHALVGARLAALAVDGAPTGHLGRTAAALAEARALMRHAALANALAERAAARVAALLSWHALLGVALADGYSHLARLRRAHVALELLASLVSALALPSTPQSLAEVMARAVLALVTKLRERHISGSTGGMGGGAGDAVEGLTAANSDFDERALDSLNDATNEADDGDDATASVDLPFEQLHGILTGLIEALLRSDASAVVRGTLCAALLHHLRFAAPVDEDEDDGDDDGGVDGDEAWLARRRVLRDGTRAALRHGGQRLVLALARDAVEAHAVWRSVAFATLEAVISRADPTSADEWVALLGHRGLLNVFVDEVVRAPSADPHAARTYGSVLLPRAPDAFALAALYAYESRASFLVRLACRPRTAVQLVQLGLLRRLAEAAFIDECSPERDEDWSQQQYQAMPLHGGADSLALSLRERRERLLQPALELVGALLASTNSADGGNDDIASDAFAFVEAHADTLSALLRDRTRALAPGRLRSLALATALLYQLAWHEPAPASSPSSKRLRRLLLALPGRFADTTQWQQRAALALMGPADVAPRDYAVAPRRWRRRVEQLLLDVLSNVLATARVLTDDPELMPAESSAAGPFLFSTRVHDANEADAASLGAVVRQLRAALDWHVAASRAQAHASRSLRTVGELPRAALLDAIGIAPPKGTAAAAATKTGRAGGGGDTQVAASDVRLRRVARSALTRELAALNGQLRSLLLCIENSVLLLWRHAELSAAAMNDGDERARSADAKLRRELHSALLEAHREPHASTFELLARLDGNDGGNNAFLYPVARRLQRVLELHQR